MTASVKQKLASSTHSAATAVQVFACFVLAGSVILGISALADSGAYSAEFGLATLFSGASFSATMLMVSFYIKYRVAHDAVQGN